MIPDKAGWWWVSENDNPAECVRVLVRRYSGEPDGLCVDDGDGPDVESDAFDWLAPVATPDEVAASTAASCCVGCSAPSTVDEDGLCVTCGYDVVVGYVGEIEKVQALAEERDGLAAEVATLTAERDALLALHHGTSGKPSAMPWRVCQEDPDAEVREYGDDDRAAWVDARGWKAWTPFDAADNYTKIGGGPETGAEGRAKADEALRANGWLA